MWLRSSVYAAYFKIVYFTRCQNYLKTPPNDWVQAFVDLQATGRSPITLQTYNPSRGLQPPMLKVINRLFRVLIR